jgi:hypothetical protein
MALMFSFSFFPNVGIIIFRPFYWARVNEGGPLKMKSLLLWQFA